MANIQSYLHSHRPLIGALITGAFYFVFTWKSAAEDEAFIDTMLWLPGLTFPIATTYYNTFVSTKHWFNVGQNVVCSILHLAGSMLLYSAAIVWVFAFECNATGVPCFSGAVGSLGYVAFTWALLNIPFRSKHVFWCVVASGAVFLPTGDWEETPWTLGAALFLWTLFNGLLINSAQQNVAVRGDAEIPAE